MHLQVQRELEEERLLAEQAAREAQAAIEAKQSELQAIEAARLRAVRPCDHIMITRVQCCRSSLVWLLTKGWL